MTIKAKVSRVIDGNQVFVTPDDPQVLRHVDGSRRLATGELAATSATRRKVGDPITITWDDANKWHEIAAPSPAPAPPAPPAPPTP